MAIVCDRFLPRARIYNRSRPEREAMLFDMVGGLIGRQTIVRPAYKNGINEIKISSDREEDISNGVAITSGYRVEFVPTRPSDFIQLHSPTEQALRDAWVIELTLQLAAEEAKPEENQDPDLIGSLKAEIRQMSRGGQGYIEQAYNALGKNSVSLWYGLQAANIPVILRSTFRLQQDRAFSFRLQRSKPAESQATHNFTVEFGDGNTLYALEIGSDGNSSKLYHYRPMSPRLREPLLDERDALLDNERLTPAEQVRRTLWREEEASIRNNARGRALEQQESLKIAQLEEADKTLLASKKMTPNQQRRLVEIEKELYLEVQSFRLQEDEADLIGQPVDVTVQFLKSGYLVIQCKDSQHVYENKRLTGWRPSGFHTMLPANSQIVLRSDGGQWAFQMGYPKFPTEAKFATPEFELDYEPDVDDMTVYNDVFFSLEDYGTEIDYVLERTQEGKTVRPGYKAPSKYQVVCTFKSDGRYSPELYAAQLHIPASQPPPHQLIWNSQTDGIYPPTGNNRIYDVEIMDDASRSRMITVTMADQPDKPLEQVLAGNAMDVYLYDRELEQDVYLTRSGKIVGNRINHNAAIPPDEPLAPCATREIRVVGMESFLDTEISALLIGDGLYPYQYLRALCRDAGLSPDEYSGIPDQFQTGMKRLPRNVPGREPLIKPSAGTRFWEFMQEVVNSHCYGWKLYNDGEKVCYHRVVDLDFTGTIDYGTRPELDPTDLYFIHTQQGNVDGIVKRQELEDYVSKVTVTGGKDNLTGNRFTHTDSIPMADDIRFKDSAYYISKHQFEYLTLDESLASPEDCALVARQALGKNPITPQGLTPWLIDIVCKFNPYVKAGYYIRVKGMKVLVSSINYGQLSNRDGEKGKQQMTVQLAEDWDA